MKRTAKACFALFKIRLAEQMQYRMAAIDNSSIGLFWAVLLIVTISVFYTYGDPETAALTLPQAISYIWLGQITHAIIAVYGIDGDLRGKIVSGDLAVELCRPLSLYSHWFARTAASRLGGGFWRFVIILSAAIIVPAAYGLSLPHSIFGFMFFVISILSAFLLGMAFTMVLTAIRIGLTWGDGPIYALVLLSGMLSGAYLPLQLWPDFLQRILFLQPFAGLMDIPFRLYVGSMPYNSAIWAIGLQSLWALIFIIMGRLIIKGKIKQLIVQGG